MFQNKEKDLYGPADFVPIPTAPYSDLQELAQRNGSRTFREMAAGRFSPFREYHRAQKDYRPYSSFKTGPEDPTPRVLLVARLTQEYPYFIAKPFFPGWELTKDFLDRILTTQSVADSENHFMRISNEDVSLLDGSAKKAEICGILFTKFFRGKAKNFEGSSKITGRRSDWEIVSRYLDPYSQSPDVVGPEIFTFRSMVKSNQTRWPQLTTEMQLDTFRSDSLTIEQKGRLVEDLIGITLETFLREVENRHVRQVAARLLRLHPYDPTHQNLYPDRVIYHMSVDQYSFLAQQFLFSEEIAKKAIPDPETIAYIPNYGAGGGSVLGNFLIPDKWIMGMLKQDPIKTLSELIYAASLARDDSNGRLREVASSFVYIPGYTEPSMPIPSGFSKAVERALIHTTLFLQEVYQWDGKIHGIYPRLRGISKKARDKYNCLEDHLASHPLLYNDPEERESRGDNPPGRGPEDDLSKIPSGPIHHLQA